jgi:hypothetical protein
MEFHWIYLYAHICDSLTVGAWYICEALLGPRTTHDKVCAPYGTPRINTILTYHSEFSSRFVFSQHASVLALVMNRSRFDDQAPFEIVGNELVPSAPIIGR